jgi:hypothetical protein
MCCHVVWRVDAGAGLGGAEELGCVGEDEEVVGLGEVGDLKIGRWKAVVDGCDERECGGGLRGGWR